MGKPEAIAKERDWRIVFSAASKQIGAVAEIS